MVMNNPL